MAIVPKKGSGISWFWLEHDFFNRVARGLSVNAIAIYTLLRARTDDNWLVRITHDQVGQSLGISARNSIRGIKELLEFGLIEKLDYQKGEGRKNPNSYRVKPVYAKKQKSAAPAAPAQNTTLNIRLPQNFDGECGLCVNGIVNFQTGEWCECASDD